MKPSNGLDADVIAHGVSGSQVPLEGARFSQLLETLHAGGEAMRYRQEREAQEKESDRVPVGGEEH